MSFLNHDNWIKKRLATAGLINKPSFIVLGAQKAGTNSLFSILDQHSSIQASEIKEIHFFDNDQWFSDQNYNDYHAYFPIRGLLNHSSKSFEATPIYLYHPEVPERLHSYNKNLKFIVMLREPASRAFSSWTMYHFHLKEGSFKQWHDPRSFDEAVNQELQNFNSGSYYTDKIGYVRRGIYFEQIERFLKFFSKDQFLFIENKALRNEFDQTVADICTFLDVKQEKLEQVFSNKSKVDKKHEYENTIQSLKDFYRPYNEKLFALLNKEFDW